MATITEVLKAVLALCPDAEVAEESDGSIVVALMQQLADDGETLIDLDDEEGE